MEKADPNSPTYTCKRSERQDEASSPPFLRNGPAPRAAGGRDPSLDLLDEGAFHELLLGENASNLVETHIPVSTLPRQSGETERRGVIVTQMVRWHIGNGKRQMACQAIRGPGSSLALAVRGTCTILVCVCVCGVGRAGGKNHVPRYMAMYTHYPRSSSMS